jgi:hypothetical protein
MADDLKERFRTLDALEFPHGEGPPKTRRISTTARLDRGRNAGTAVFALVLAAIAIAFVIRAFGDGTDRTKPPVSSVGEIATGPGTCDYGPWIEHCPEADWARSVIDVAGLEIVEEQTVLVVGASEGGEFLFWAMDPSLHGQVTPLAEMVARGEAVETNEVDGVSIYGGDRRVWLWSSHGLNVFVDGREARDAPSRQDLVALVRASGSVPYAPATASASVTVPDIVGLSDQGAMRTLDGLGLSWVVAYRTVDGVDPWHVASSDPVAGTRVAPGSSVRVLVATTVTPLPAGAADALDCDPLHREAFGGPRARVLPGDSAYIHGNLPGITSRDDVVQVTFEDEPWMGLWHVIRDGSVVAVVDYGSLDGAACQGSGVAGA